MKFNIPFSLNSNSQSFQLKFNRPFYGGFNDAIVRYVVLLLTNDIVINTDMILGICDILFVL